MAQIFTRSHRIGSRPGQHDVRRSLRSLVTPARRRVTAVVGLRPLIRLAIARRTGSVLLAWLPSAPGTSSDIDLFTIENITDHPATANHQRRPSRTDSTSLKAFAEPWDTTCLAPHR